METTLTNTKYVEWLSADEMHQGSKEWLSELEFVRDEHLFFEDLIKSYTLQLIEPEKFSNNKEIIDALNRSQKKNNRLIEIVKSHESELKVMLDGKDQIKLEEAYRKVHKALIIEISNFLKYYRLLKTQLFTIVKQIKRAEKTRRLID